MKKIPLLLFGAATIFLSCEAKQTTKDTANSQTEMTPTAASSSAEKTAELEAQQISGEPQVATDAGQKPALNPAHGEPYHRCDIQVGAPLNSEQAPQNTVQNTLPQQMPANNSFNTNPIAPSASPVPSVSSSAATGPKPALNPAHGEPHHRCDLQVGAPLT